MEEEEEAQKETFMSDYEQGKLLKGISNRWYAAQSDVAQGSRIPWTYAQNFYLLKICMSLFEISNRRNKSLGHYNVLQTNLQNSAHCFAH